MKSENEKLTEAARMLSRNCEERLDSCKGCLFCRSDLLCKLRGVPAEWNRDFGLDEHIVDVNKKVGTPTDTPTATDTPTDTPTDTLTTRAEILDAAKKIVTGDREKQYGKPEDNFAVIAEFWTTYIGHPISSEDVAIMMALLKIARIRSGNYKADSFVDGVGYLSLAAEIAGR